MVNIINKTIFDSLQKQEATNQIYTKKDSMYKIRTAWYASMFKHIVHLVPGDTVLHLASGDNLFSKSLYKLTKGRNPITCLNFNSNLSKTNTNSNLEEIFTDSYPLKLTNKYDYIILYNVLSSSVIKEVLNDLYNVLNDGGQIVCIQWNPWNPFYILMNNIRKMLNSQNVQYFQNEKSIFELLSEMGYIKISIRFSDFLYSLIPKSINIFFKNISVILENTPLIKILSRTIIIKAVKSGQKKNDPKSLCYHKKLFNKITVVIPCYNEEMNIAPIYKSICELYGDYICQFIFVDDNSTDKTNEIIKSLSSNDERVQCIRRNPPNGVGLAIKEGYKLANGDYILSMDCDFVDILPEIEGLFDSIGKGNDAVLGSRFSLYSVLYNYPFKKILANRLFHLLFNIIFFQKRRDFTNNLKIIKRDLINGMQFSEVSFAINAEIGIQLVSNNNIIVDEVPISWINRSLDQGSSSFSLVKSGGGYLRVLLKYWFKKYIIL
jgi:dolichol-phosphate mannosyltransferase